MLLAHGPHLGEQRSEKCTPLFCSSSGLPSVLPPSSLPRFLPPSPLPSCLLPSSLPSHFLVYSLILACAWASLTCRFLPSPEDCVTAWPPPAGRGALPTSQQPPFFSGPLWKGLTFTPVTFFTLWLEGQGWGGCCRVWEHLSQTFCEGSTAFPAAPRCSLLEALGVFLGPNSPRLLVWREENSPAALREAGGCTVAESCPLLP